MFCAFRLKVVLIHSFLCCLRLTYKIPWYTQVVDELVGANCKDVTPGEPSAALPAWPGGKVPPIKARFQEGSVDEVSFLAPELGPLAAILVAPESGTWSLDEVHVCSSRTNHMDRWGSYACGSCTGCSDERYMLTD